MKEVFNFLADSEYIDLVKNDQKYRAEFGDLLAKLPPRPKSDGPDKRKKEYKLFIKLVKERKNADEKKIRR